MPFRGGNQALTELLGKRLDFLVDPPVALLGQIKSGTLRAIGITGDKRFAPLPDVGTVAEAGFPGFNVTSWMGVVGPAKLPEPIVKQINDVNTSNTVINRTVMTNLYNNPNAPNVTYVNRQVPGAVVVKPGWP